VLADAAGNAGEFALAALAIDHQMPVFVRQRDEIPFGIDDHLLHPLSRLLEQTPEQMRLAGPGIALHQKPCRQQFLDVEHGRLPAGQVTHVDPDLHLEPTP
jgi:hypothetical protein